MRMGSESARNGGAIMKELLCVLWGLFILAFLPSLFINPTSGEDTPILDAHDHVPGRDFINPLKSVPVTICVSEIDTKIVSSAGTHVVWQGTRLEFLVDKPSF